MTFTQDQSGRARGREASLGDTSEPSACECCGCVHVHLWGAEEEAAVSPLETVITMGWEEPPLCVMEAAWPPSCYMAFGKALKPPHIQVGVHISDAADER